MSELIKLLKIYSDKSVLDEDGLKVGVEFNNGSSIDEILKYQDKNSIALPQNFIEILLYSDGIKLFGLEILSLREMWFFLDSNLIAFHSWGNGDFDCLSLGKEYPKGKIIFMSRSKSSTAVVSDTLENWFKSVINEIEEFGTLFHPMDYNTRNIEGMYKNVSSKIQE